jgi:hypothetical protein
VNFCGKLSMDVSSAVRAEFVDTVGTWLCKLDERLDHQGRLLPYLLTALSDSHPAVASRAFDQIERIGALYELDNAGELKDVLYYLPTEAHNIGWLTTTDVWQRCEATGGASRKLPIPPPFVARPRVGSRRVVAANFGHIAHAVASELSSWHAEHRHRGAQLLASYLVFIEDWVGQYLYELVPALCRALVVEDQVREGERALVVEVARCCSLMGLFLPCEAFLEVALPRVEDESAEVMLRAAALAAVAANLSGGGAKGFLDTCLPRLLAALDSAGVIDVQACCCKFAVGDVLEACVAGASPQWLQAHQMEVLSVLLRVEAWPDAASAADRDALKMQIQRTMSDTVGKLASVVRGEQAQAIVTLEAGAHNDSTASTCVDAGQQASDAAMAEKVATLAEDGKLVRRASEQGGSQMLVAHGAEQAVGGTLDSETVPLQAAHGLPRGAAQAVAGVEDWVTRHRSALLARWENCNDSQGGGRVLASARANLARLCGCSH